MCTFGSEITEPASPAHCQMDFTKDCWCLSWETLQGKLCRSSTGKTDYTDISAEVVCISVGDLLSVANQMPASLTNRDVPAEGSSKGLGLFQHPQLYLFQKPSELFGEIFLIT